MLTAEPTPVHLRGGGVSVVIDASTPVPAVIHWGRDLGALPDEALASLRQSAVPGIAHSAPDIPRSFSIWPSQRDGWVGTPALTGHADGRAAHSRVRVVGVDRSDAAAAFQLEDPAAGLRITVRYELHPSGILAVATTLERDATLTSGDSVAPYTLGSVVASMPIPGDATELLDFTGGWLRERRPQRRPIAFGSHARESRRGRPGHDAAFLTVAGTPAFGFRSGELWAVHLAWSGNQRYTVDRLPEGAGALATAIGAGELLEPGELQLEDRERYEAPTALFGWSGQGLDELAGRFHRYQRERRGRRASPRPLMLNTWESVYFDHELPRLLELVDKAAEVGVERFVLDDGWFSGRRDASRALGDWVVDPEVWPNGLHPLAERVRSHGMQFGLWVEPEMVSLRSQLAVDNPEWVLAPDDDPGPSARNQYALDLADAEAYRHILERLDALVTEYDLDYLKWDHNRDLLQPESRGLDGGRPLVHAQTAAVYRMMGELRARHPSLEIESCAAGGARVDLGIARHVDRFWASDCNDPVERIDIDRWTGVLLPPETIGVHVGGPRAHTTGRVTDLSFRLASSLFGHSGIEWDLSSVPPDELAAVIDWARFYRETRALVLDGLVVNADLADDATVLRGVLSQDARRGLFLWARIRSSVPDQSGRVRIPGLRRDADYRVRALEPFGPVRRSGAQDPGWMADRAGFTCAGRVLADAGLPLPSLAPESALLLEFEQLGS